MVPAYESRYVISDRIVIIEKKVKILVSFDSLHRFSVPGRNRESVVTDHVEEHSRDYDRRAQ